MGLASLGVAPANSLPLVRSPGRRFEQHPAHIGVDVRPGQHDRPAAHADVAVQLGIGAGGGPSRGTRPRQCRPAGRSRMRWCPPPRPPISSATVATANRPTLRSARRSPHSRKASITTNAPTLLSSPGPRDQVVAQLAHAQRERHHVSHAHPVQGIRLVIGSNVDPEVADLQLPAFAFLGGHPVDRRGPDDALDRTAQCPHREPRSRQHPRINPADRREAEEPRIGDPRHHQPDLVDVPGEHHPHRRINVQAHDRVAVEVGGDPVGERCHSIADDPRHRPARPR